MKQGVWKQGGLKHRIPRSAQMRPAIHARASALGSAPLAPNNRASFFLLGEQVDKDYGFMKYEFREYGFREYGFREYGFREYGFREYGFREYEIQGVWIQGVCISGMYGFQGGLKQGVWKQGGLKHRIPRSTQMRPAIHARASALGSA